MDSSSELDHGNYEKLQLLDRIELRRFVGREFLLWLWFETEMFEATLSTKEHGSFGLWVEGRLVLSEGRESTVIKGSAPGHHREAKEGLLRGKIPERAGLHLSWGDRECTVTLRGETLAFAGLSAPTSREEASEEPPPDAPKRPRKKKTSAEADALAAVDEAHESFYERMHYARDVEEVFTALYRDFLALRLSDAWDATVHPSLEAWTLGRDVNERAYRAARTRAIGR